MLRLRPPRPDEGRALTELCLRSKASHGYNAAFMDACSRELTVAPSGDGLIVVAELHGTRVGLVEISVSGCAAELEKMFVEPTCHGQGIGRALFKWAETEAAARGACVLRLDADPGAVAFYERMGAVVVGCSPSGSIPGRTLPRLELGLASAAAD